MSMLSAQCDELREMAGQLQEHGTFVGFGGTTNTDPLMHGAAIVMREAADTIWELRDMAHKELAENDKLRDEQREYQATIDSLVDECADHKAENAKLRKELEESPKCETCEAMLDCDECLRADKPRKDRKRLVSENIELRELCKELLDLCYDAYNQEWGWDDDWALAYEQAKKLGVDDV